MRFKKEPGKDARVTGIQPELIIAMMVVNTLFVTKFKAYELVITSCTDGTHSSTSLHYAGAAFDIRTRDMPFYVVEELKQLLDDALPVDFDVVVESSHMHIESQPRKL